MGSASKITSVVLRVWELICSCVVVGIIGTYLSYLGKAHTTSGRMDYVIATASISLIGSLAFAPPLRYSFYAFPFDLAMFIMWMVAFGLMIDLTGTEGCNSTWYWNNWGYYWGGYYTYNSIASQNLVGTTACAQWRAVLAFAFMGGWTWLVSMCLGMYVVYRERKETKSNSFGNPSGLVTQISDAPMENTNIQTGEKNLHGVSQTMNPYSV